MNATDAIYSEHVRIPDDAPVVIRAWRERGDGTRYDGQMSWCAFRDLPQRIERYWRQRRYAIAVLRSDDEALGDDAIEVGRVCKNEDTGHWTWWSDGPDTKVSA